MTTYEWQRVTSVHSPVVKDVTRLHLKKGRGDTRLFLVEGEISVKEALPVARIRRILVREDAQRAGEVMVRGHFPPGTVKIPELFTLSYDAMARISTTDTPPPVAAVVEMVDVPVTTIEKKAQEAVARAAEGHGTRGLGEVFMGCVRIQDPGNIGTIIRAADAFGVGGILLSAGSVDPYNPKVVRSTMGSIFHMPLTIGVTLERQIAMARNSGIRIASTVPEGGIPLPESDLTGPIFLLLGAEVEGLPMPALEEADIKVTIPMAGRAESLNVGVAGSVILYEALRQRSGLDKPAK